MDRIAVLGSGATGYVVLNELSATAKDVPIDVFEGGPTPPVHPLEGQSHDRWSGDDFAALHAEIRATVGRSFPPPKSHFGATVPRHAAVPAGHTLWRSAAPGGLTRYWSASLLPFTARELESWGFDAAYFDAHYAAVATLVGLAARDDGLNRYFGRSFATRPPIELTRLAERLVDSISIAPQAASIGLIAGANRAAIETRAGHARVCVSCGGCFYGCPSGSVFNAATAEPPRRHAELRRISEKVLFARRTTTGFELETARAKHGPYRRVYSAAGCIGSTELVARSFLEANARPSFVDNELFVLPIFYLGSAIPSAARHIAIANALLGLLPDEHGAPYAEVHVAPIPDLLTRFYLPRGLERAALALARGLRGRILLAKLYLHSSTAPQLELRAAAEGPVVGLAREGRGSTERLPVLLSRLRRGLAGSGFMIPRAFPALRSKTSSHYAAALGPGSRYAADRLTGEVVPEFHVVDSAVLPFSPAQPLTFTAMANARRIVQATT